MKRKQKQEKEEIRRNGIKERRKESTKKERKNWE